MSKKMNFENKILDSLSSEKITQDENTSQSQLNIQIQEKKKYNSKQDLFKILQEDNKRLYEESNKKEEILCKLIGNLEQKNLTNEVQGIIREARKELEVEKYFEKYPRCQQIPQSVGDNRQINRPRILKTGNNKIEQKNTIFAQSSSNDILKGFHDLNKFTSIKQKDIVNQPSLFPKHIQFQVQYQSKQQQQSALPIINNNVQRKQSNHTASLDSFDILGMMTFQNNKNNQLQQNKFQQSYQRPLEKLSHNTRSTTQLQTNQSNNSKLNSSNNTSNITKIYQNDDYFNIQKTQMNNQQQSAKKDAFCYQLNNLQMNNAFEDIMELTFENKEEKQQKKQTNKFQDQYNQQDQQQYIVKKYKNSLNKFPIEVFTSKLQKINKNNNQ